MRKLFLTLGAFLLAAPVFLLCGAAVTPQAPLLWLLPLAAALGLSGCARLLPGKKRVAGALTAMALAAGAAVFIGLKLETGLIVLLPALLSAAAAAAHARLLALPEGAVPATLWYGGLAVYLAARVLGALNGLSSLPGPLRVFGLIYAVYLVFWLSGRSLREGAGGGRGPSRVMKLRTAGAAALMALLLLILTHLPLLRRWVRQAVLGVMGLALRLMEWLGGLLPGQSGAGGGGSGDLGGLAAENGETALIWVILEKLACAVAVLLAAAAALLALRAALKGLRRAFKKLAARWRAYAGALTDAYEDTVESLVDWGEVRRSFSPRRARAARREKEPPWQALSPRQRVRRSYRDFLRRHPDLPESRTARQALGGGALSELYEAARYGSREITPGEAEESRKMADRR